MHCTPHIKEGPLVPKVMMCSGSGCETRVLPRHEALRVSVGVDIFQELCKFISPNVNLKRHHMYTVCN
jgi:hypothetical protein